MPPSTFDLCYAFALVIHGKRDRTRPLDYVAARDLARKLADVIDREESDANAREWQSPLAI